MFDCLRSYGAGLGALEFVPTVKTVGYGPTLLSSYIQRKLCRHQCPLGGSFRGG